MSKPEPAPDRWNLTARIPRAIKILSSAKGDEVVLGFIRDRLNGKTVAPLPPLEFQEMPADLFVQVYNEATRTKQWEIAALIGRSCASLLDLAAKDLGGTPLVALAELIYLAGRIESRASILPLTAISEAVLSSNVLPNNETIRLKCLRSLVPTLAKFPSEVAERHRDIFKNNMFDPSSSLIALTGLIAFFHEDRKTLLEQLEKRHIVLSGEILDLSLQMIGLPD